MSLTIRPASADEVVDVLAEAFAGYPVMNRILGPVAGDPERIRELTRLFVINRELRGDPVLLAEEQGVGLAAMTMTPPDSPAAPPELEPLALATWARLGADAQARYDAFADAANSVEPEEPNLHVNMVGVRPLARGRGLARRLLDQAHRRSARRPDSRGVGLTTENPANVPFYEHLGYRVVGHAQVADDFATWGLFRPDDAGSASPAAPHPGRSR